MISLEVKTTLQPEMLLNITVRLSMPEICPKIPIVWWCSEHGKIFTLDFPAVN